MYFTDKVNKVMFKENFFVKNVEEELLYGYMINQRYSEVFTLDELYKKLDVEINNGRKQVLNRRINDIKNNNFKNLIGV